MIYCINKAQYITGVVMKGILHDLFTYLSMYACLHPSIHLSTIRHFVNVPWDKHESMKHSWDSTAVGFRQL